MPRTKRQINVVRGGLIHAGDIVWKQHIHNMCFVILERIIIMA